MLPLMLSLALLISLASAIGVMSLVKQRQRHLLAAMSARLTRLDGDKARLECTLIPVRREVKEQREKVAELREFYELLLEGYDPEAAIDVLLKRWVPASAAQELERRSGLPLKELFALPTGKMIDLLIVPEPEGATS